MTQDWTVARFAAALLLTWCAACGGDDDDSVDAAPVQDASPPGDAVVFDASVVDCLGDHRESQDGSNDPFSPEKNGQAERTDLVLSAGGAAFTICGQIDPRQATDQAVDYDSFVFEVTGSEPVNLRIELGTGGVDAEIALHLFRVDGGPPVSIASVPFRNDYALVAGITADPGTYWVSAAGLPPAAGAPVLYTIAIAENQLSCSPPDADPDYVEAGDSSTPRGNDTIAIEHPNPAMWTEEAGDAPEATDLVLEPGDVRVVRGVSAMVPSAGDSYLDRDAYLFETGRDTSELELRLSWPDGDVDLDVYLFDADDPARDYSVDLGALNSNTHDELMTLNVDPGRRYLLWVAAFDSTLQGGADDLPREYDVILCSREHTTLLPALEPR